MTNGPSSLGQRLAIACLALAAAIAAACSSSGGGGGSQDSAGPTISFASFVGFGATPQVGDGVVLTFDEPVTIATGATLDDDFVLSSGSLGSSPSIVSVSAQVLQISLGAGATFTPGTTTIVLGPDNDVVLDLVGNRGNGGDPRTIADGDAEPPAISLLSVEGIDTELNGTGNAGGRLQTFRNGFTITVRHSDASSLPDPQKTIVTADRTVFVDGFVMPPNQDLSGILTVGGDASETNLTVPANVLFSLGDVTLTAYAIDTTDRPSPSATFSLRTTDRNNRLRPFENGQLWFLDTSRDVESYTVTTNGAGTAVSNVAIANGSNGQADLADLFAVVGLRSSNPIPNVQGGLDSNEVVEARFEQRVTSRLATLFAATTVTFTFDPPGSFPSGQLQVPYGSAGFSQICVAGAPGPTPSGVLGAALFDPHNDRQEDNCGSLQNTRLGVFVHTAVRVGYLSGSASMFRTTYDPLTPAISGIPVGGDSNDGARLTGALQDGRATQIDNAIERMAQLVAVVVAHECGHSMGLVANGAMPAGLYGDDPINFPLSGGQPPSNADGHIENTSLFPAGSQNVMSPALDFTSTQSSNTTFNTLNSAYLREQAAYNR